MGELFGGETSAPPTEKRTRIRSKTPQSASAVAASSAASSSAPAAVQAKAKAKPAKGQDTAAAAEAPAETYTPPSKLTSQAKIIENMIKVAEDPRFDKEDAATVGNIIAETDTTDKELRKTMIERLKEIYQRNYHRMKNDKKNEKKT